jgi:TldD protein
VDPIATLDSTAKVELLGKVEKLARAKDPRVAQVMAGLASEYDVVMVARADGTLAADVRPLVRLSVTVIAEQNGRREMGSSGGGGRFGLAYFDDAQHQRVCERGGARRPDQSGVAPRAGRRNDRGLGPGWPGILLHEAIGHGLEGDFNRKGSSAFSGRIGQRVAAKGVTVLDDGTIADRRGSLNVDDEGNASQRNVLIEDGILKGYIQDAMNARLMGVKPTGNGRRESYAHIPMPRMTNTYMLGGDKEPARNRGQHQEGPVRHQLRRRAGGHHQRQVRVQRQRSLLGGKRQDPVPRQGRHHCGQAAPMPERA